MSLTWALRDRAILVCSSAAASSPPASEALTRAADTLKRHFMLGVAQPFVVVRHAEIISIAPLARARPAAIAHLARQALGEIEHNSERSEGLVAGISTMCAGLDEVARGYQAARLAAESAAVGGGVHAFLEKATSIASDGSTKDGASSGLTGYSILKADDPAAATNLAKGCPVLSSGGTVEVYETIQVI